MNGNDYWIYWLLAGFIPYNIERYRRRNGRILCMRALFWSVEIHSRGGKLCRWVVRIPLIERCRNAIWATIAHFQRDNPPHE